MTTNAMLVLSALPHCTVCTYPLEVARQNQHLLDVVLINSKRQRCDRWGDCDVCSKAQLIPVGAL